MSGFNGAGTWSRTYNWTQDANNGIDIDPGRQDTEWGNSTSGFNTAFCRDGQAIATGNWNLGAFKITNYGSSAARTDIPSTAQVQDSSFLYGGTAGGTVNDITIAVAPAITAYVTGQRFSFKAHGDNTAAVTIAVNGLTAKAIKRTDGSALLAGDIKDNQICDIELATANFQLLNRFIPDESSQTGKLLAIQKFTTSGTYTPTAGALSAIVEMCGGGGDGGEVIATGVGELSVNSGGAAGAYQKFNLATPTVQTVTIGAAGGTTSFGTLAVSSGGSTPSTAGAGSATLFAAIPSPGTNTTFGTVRLVAMAGQGAGVGINLHAATNDGLGGEGASSPLGSGGRSRISSGAGNDASGFGAGGGGALNLGNQAGGHLGGDGTPGVVFVYEYS